MKAAVYTRYGPPDVVQIQDVEKPEPSDNEVLIQVRAGGVTVRESAVGHVPDETKQRGSDHPARPPGDQKGHLSHLEKAAVIRIQEA